MLSGIRPYIMMLAVALPVLASEDKGASVPDADNTNLMAKAKPAAKASLTPEAEPVPAAARRLPTASALGEHAPLAWFSLGSLAVGGIFYAIDTGIDRPNVAYTAGDRTRITTTVAVAGVGALLAAGSWFYYTHLRESREAPDDGLDADISGGLDAQGLPAVSARLSLPLGSLPGFR